MKRYYQCPVCGYNRMLEPPQSWYICPCCGTEFENDDDELSHSELRSRWIARCVPWFSKAQKPPKNWNAYQQLFDSGLWGELIDLRPADDEQLAVKVLDNAIWGLPDLLGCIKPVAA